MNKDAKIYVAGHTGMVGSAIVRALKAQGFTNLLLRTRGMLHLQYDDKVYQFFRDERPEYVFLAAAKVGGIVANRDRPADFLFENLAIQMNVLQAAAAFKVKKLLFLGSSCIYPKLAKQPIGEEALLTGPLEPTNEWYAIAKIAGIKMCQALRRQNGCNFIAAMPCNLYGPGDNYHPEHSHVIPGLIRRFHESKVQGHPNVVCWGSGTPLREFLYVDDLAEACLLLMEEYNGELPINVGSGQEHSILDIAELVAMRVGYQGPIVWDRIKPDGTPRKVLDSSRLRALGWKPKTALTDGLFTAYEDFKRRCGGASIAV